MARGVTVATPLNKLTLLSKLALGTFIKAPLVVILLFYKSVGYTATPTLIKSIGTTLSLKIPSRLVRHDRIYHRQIPHLIVGHGPAPVWVKLHQLSKNHVIVVNILPIVCHACSINHRCALPDLSGAIGGFATVNGSVHSEILLAVFETVYSVNLSSGNQIC